MSAHERCFMGRKVLFLSGEMPSMCVEESNVERQLLWTLVPK